MINLELLRSLKRVVKSLRVGVISTILTGSVIATNVFAQEMGYPTKQELKFADMASLM